MGFGNKAMEEFSSNFQIIPNKNTNLRLKSEIVGNLKHIGLDLLISRKQFFKNKP